VHDWPGQAGDEIPSPALVAAWLALDMLMPPTGGPA
jgi:hypothetical protein